MDMGKLLAILEIVLPEIYRYWCCIEGLQKDKRNWLTRILAAQLAWDCIQSVPLDTLNALELVRTIKPYLDWQSTTAYLKNPPAEYTAKIQSPVDIFGGLDKIESRKFTDLENLILDFVSTSIIFWQYYKSHRQKFIDIDIVLRDSQTIRTSGVSRDQTSNG